MLGMLLPVYPPHFQMLPGHLWLLVGGACLFSARISAVYQGRVCYLDLGDETIVTRVIAGVGSHVLTAVHATFSVQFLHSMGFFSP